MKVKPIIDSVVEKPALEILSLLSKIKKWPYYYAPPFSGDDVAAERLAWHDKTQTILHRVKNIIDRANDPTADMALSGDIMNWEPINLEKSRPHLDGAFKQLDRIRSDFQRSGDRLDIPSSVFDYFMHKVQQFVLAIVILSKEHFHDSELVKYAKYHGLWPNFTP